MTGHSRYIANASQSYTFASHTSQHTDQSLQKSMPAQPHGDRKVDERKEQRRHNTGLAKVAVQCFVGQFCGYINFSASYESLVLINRHLRQARNRYGQV